MATETLVLRLSGSSHVSSPPSGSSCRRISLRSTPAFARGQTLTDTSPSPAVVVQNTPNDNKHLLDSDLSSVLKGQRCVRV